MIRHIQTPGIVRTVYSSILKDIKGYLGIFRDIDAYSATLTGAQLRGREKGQGGGRGGSPALFDNRKKCLDFGKKGPDCVHLWVKFCIQSILLRVYARKNSWIIRCGALFCVFEEMFIKVPQFHKPL